MERLVMFDRYWVEQARLHATGSTLEKIENIASDWQKLVNSGMSEEARIHEECCQKIASGTIFDTAERWLHREIKKLRGVGSQPHA